MMKRKPVVFLLLLVLALASAGRTDAQFWKKIFHKKHKDEQTQDKKTTPPGKSPKKETPKEQKKREKKERKKEKQERKQKKKGVVKNDTHKSEAKFPVQEIKKRPELSYPLTTMKASYRIDVLAPMYLDELVNGQYVTFTDKMPEKAIPGVSFYEGISIAADSLKKKAGYHMDIYIHDVASFAESSEMLVNKGLLDSSDLIIGAVATKDVAGLAAFAKKKHINFISALSASDGGVKDNPYFTLVQPSLKSHCEWLTGYLARKFPGQKITVLHRTSVPADDNAYKYITADTSRKLLFVPFVCNSTPGKDSLGSLFDNNKPNIVVLPILDNAFADSILKSLLRNFPGTHFAIYGMPSWNTLPTLYKANAYRNMSINITYPYNFDLTSPAAKYVDKAFKKQYAGKVTEMVYRGYETMFWYAYLLQQYGTVFNTRYSDNSAAPFTKFEVKPQRDKNNDFLYEENCRLFLSTCEGGSCKTQ